MKKNSSITKKRIFRSAKSGKFVLGTKRYSKISAVEGIVLPASSVKASSTAKRRAEISRKFSKG